MRRTLLKFTLMLVLAIAIAGCANNETPAPKVQKAAPMSQFDWLVGEWERTGRTAVMLEQWQKTDDNKMNAVVYKISGSDSAVTERISLEVSADGIYYIPLVDHNPGPVSFKLVDDTNEIFVFENKAHDFPNRIIYRQLTPDSLHARIEGSNDGKAVGVDFFFARKSN